jgi:hypothetical protein
MKSSAWRARPILSVVGLFISVLVCAQVYAAPPAGKKLTDPVVAQKLGVSVQQLHSLRARFDLSNEYMANLAIACMSMDPANANVIYAGTGEGEYNIDSIRGAGVFKTTDGGATWNQLAAT